MAENDWLQTGLSHQQLQNIGLVTIIWNAVELNLQELIWVAAGWRPRVGAVTTMDMGNIARYQLAKNIVNLGYSHERLLADTFRAVEFFDLCRIRRNALVHGMPVYDDEQQLSGRLARFDAKRGTGELKTSHLNVTDEFLDTLTKDLWLCRMTLTDAMRKVSRFRKLRADPPEDFEAQVFEYADPPLDTTHVQMRLDLLRSLPPSQNTRPDPPPASGV